MRRILAVGMVVALVAVGFAMASQLPGIGGLLGFMRGGQSLPVLQTGEMPFRYPLRLWREGVEGEVLLRIHVTAVGTVDSVELERSSGHAELDSIALRGARQLRYDPAVEGERPVATWAMLPVRFTRNTDAGSTEGQ
ncbi:MAG: TonB family protein [Gemmatimonadetes bacterium]|nr:TonB family protein [Gemmatimonadota bacterium]NIO31598.1 TonB family protein [Gemmatimonadota bacterium]